MSYKADLIETIAFGTFSVSGSITTPDQWARQKIAERTTKFNKIPIFYKECLRYLISRMGNLSYINSEGKLIDIKCVHANPERTIGKLEEDNNIILPIVSISQSSSDNADSRRRGAPQIVNEVFWSDVKKRAVRVISEAPRAVDIQYSINIWAKYKGNLDQIVEQIRLIFNPHLVVKNPYTNVAQAFIEQETDESEIDISDREDRVLRRSFSVKLEAYIPNPQFLITSTGEIEELTVDSSIY